VSFVKHHDASEASVSRKLLDQMMYATMSLRNQL